MSIVKWDKIDSNRKTKKKMSLNYVRFSNIKILYVQAPELYQRKGILSIYQKLPECLLNHFLKPIISTA